MALQDNYLVVEEESYTRELPTRVYANQSSYPPSRETRTNEFPRYPSFSKIFNNRPSFGETDFRGQYSMGQQAPPVPSQSLCKKAGPHQKVRFVERREEFGGGGGNMKKEANPVEEQTVDRAADGFINWKHRSLQKCKTFAD